MKEKIFIVFVVVIALLGLVKQYKRTKLEIEANKAVIEGCK